MPVSDAPIDRPSYQAEPWFMRPLSVWPLLRSLLRGRRLISGLSVTGALLTGILSALSPLKYTATAKFIPQEPAATGQSGLGQLAQQLGIATPRASATSPQFYADLLQTKGILRDLVISRYSLTGAPGSSGDLVDYFRVERRNGDEAVAVAMRRAQRMLSIGTDRVTGVITFSIVTPSPELSAQLVNRLLDLVNQFNLLRRQSQGRAEREFVEQRLALALGALTDAEDSLETFYRRNRRVADSPQLVAEEGRLQRRVTLRQQVYVALSQSYEAAKLEEVRNTPLITVIERPSGFLEATPRRLMLRCVGGLLAGSMVAAILLLTSEYLARRAQAGGDEYGEFLVELRRFLAGGASWLRRRHAG